MADNQKLNLPAKRRKLDFLILYEHVVREYESILLLQAELARRGYTSEIHQLLGRKRLRYRTSKQPEVIVSSCMYDDEAINSHVYNNVGRCNKIVNLHWEQMLSDTQEEGTWFNFGGNAKRCVQTCWGQKTADRLIAHGMEAKNCPVTGAVMMDFLRPEFAGYFRDKAALCKAHGLDSQKRLLLYISSFGYASMTGDEVRELSDMAGEDFTGFARTNRESMQATLAWFDTYLGAHPEVVLVYRRHPSEWNSPALAALAQKRANFHVIFADSVKQWIVAADEIFIWMSTAIAEVYAANKSCHILRPQPIEHAYDPVIYKGAQYVQDYAAFAAAADAGASTVPADGDATGASIISATDGAASTAADAGDATAVAPITAVSPDGAAAHANAAATGASPLNRVSFPIDKAVIEGYFDKNDTPAYLRTAALLEQVYREPPRDTPFAPPFKARFNWLKYVALLGIHALYAIKLDPKVFARICPPFARFAGRIYGYIDKAYISPADIAAMRARIAPYVK